ncbi:MAG: response regulator [Acidobacteriota bacterium]|nr:response regulator [Acidobacteriota bacterium]
MEASDVEEALELALRECTDLTLMDLNMPQMDGLQAAQRIRECKEACKNARIVAVTAYDTYGMEEAAPEDGFDEYLVKPVNFDELDRVLNYLL